MGWNSEDCDLISVRKITRCIIEDQSRTPTMGHEQRGPEQWRSKLQGLLNVERAGFCLSRLFALDYF